MSESVPPISTPKAGRAGRFVVAELLLLRFGLFRQFVAREVAAIDRIVQKLVDVRARGGRLFMLGVGGSAANASHAVNDFRKICGIETYAPTDNVSELTARTNDDGWDTVFVNWLRVSKLTRRDMLFVLSVGGGDLE